eukprot:CAMPEP_0206466802 /NCGR_PEP_ID=MMETSP0324_2-20121206/28675_1 /ASSEMBLY_ACC=CAM_ASM_000836 /TAXON_ID=2866 /ORGANISM="Crypthecodinium cohnii, Strain Seligo" /LENGTH=124 /DNA_ID=CAMNT_0053939987 /DNA_START=359 /DNA_END=730 /DNA_ORIENTATION=-
MIRRRQCTNEDCPFAHSRRELRTSAGSRRLEQGQGQGQGRDGAADDVDVDVDADVDRMREVEGEEVREVAPDEEPQRLLYVEGDERQLQWPGHLQRSQPHESDKFEEMRPALVQQQQQQQQQQQ